MAKSVLAFSTQNNALAYAKGLNAGYPRATRTTGPGRHAPSTTARYATAVQDSPSAKWTVLARPWIAGAATYGQASGTALTLNLPRLLFDGNSHIEGTGGSGLQITAFATVVSLTGRGPFDLYNYGVGGQTTLQMSSDAGTQVFPNFNAARGDILAMWEGTNHLFLDSSVTATTAYNAIVSYCQAAAAAGVTRIVAGTAMPRFDGGGSYETRRTALNTLLRSGLAAAVTGATVVIADVGGDSLLGVAGAFNNATYFDPNDFTHLLPAGHDRAGSIFAAAAMTLP